MSDSNVIYAGFWIRVISSIIDSLILMLVALVLYGLSFGIAVFVPIALLYFTVFNASQLRATPGKAIMGLQVVSENGRRLSYLASFIRYILFSFTWFLFFVMFFSEKKKTVPDYAAMSVVIKREPPATNYFSVWFSGFAEMWQRLKGVVSGREPVRYEVSEELSHPDQDSSPNCDTSESGYDVSAPQASDFSQGTQFSPLATSAPPGLDRNERIKVELQQLYKLFLEGLLTAEDYEKKRAELTSQLS